MDGNEVMMHCHDGRVINIRDSEDILYTVRITIASNSTKGKISVSSDGKVTIKSTEKETYIVECVISADHYKTFSKAYYIYVK